MSQLVFKFPFKIKYDEHDFYVSSNNFKAYKLIESWPHWPGKSLNVFGDKRIRQNSFVKDSRKKIKKLRLLNHKKLMIR